jgi:predicted transcriptional regulator
MQNAESQSAKFLDLTGTIVSAYVSNNPVQSASLPDLIRNVYAALNGLAHGEAQAVPEDSPAKPTAGQIRKSVTPDGIVSFLDGKTYQTMKRHLTGHGFDPHSYRAYFGLPADYPMVSPRYAAKRSELAKAIGLGRVADRSEDEQSQAMRRKKAA